MNYLSINNNHLQVVISLRGAEIHSIFDVRNQIEYLWQGDPRYWADRSPLLFPIVGRLRHGVYSHEGKTFSMESPHGFIKSQIFQPTLVMPDRVVLQTESTQETRRQYPFAFRFSVEYRLVDAGLVFVFQIENTGDQPLPFSLGTHSGFRVPFFDENFEHYSLMFECEENPYQVELDGVFLSGKTSAFTLQSHRILPLRRRLFEREAIILGGIQKKSVSLIDPEGIARWSLYFDDFDYLTLWQPPRTDAPFVCLECWNGLPDPGEAKIDVLSRKPGIRVLVPGKTAHFSLQIELLSYFG